MKHEIGLSSSLFGRRPPVEDDFRQFHEFGIKHVEVSLLRGWTDPDIDQTVSRICRWIEKYDITVNSVHGPSGAPVHEHWLADPDENERRKNVQERRIVLEGARRLGAKYVVIEYECYDRWPYWIHNKPPVHVFPDSKEIWQRSIDALIGDAARTGVKLAIENVNNIPCAPMAQRLAGYDPDLIGFCFDSSHATFGGYFFEELTELIPRIIGTHLSDNDGLENNLWDDRHWPPFHGIIDWDRLMKTLVTSTLCPVFIVEVLSPEKKITHELADSLDQLRNLMQKMDASPPDSKGVLLT